ncbi:MAG: 16S rRNA (cytosine(1402)-N(4))-methyltransferase RsmH [Ignavibacteriales bacterium]|nr:16S rRNA (cytosine(1402)-N(4))-methyltransferase RsmH [Ignavibacteriales bacterium]
MAVRLASYHTPVLREEVLTWLITSAGNVYVDATLGGGGHAESILQQLDPTGVLVGLDADPDAIQFATSQLSSYQGRAVLVHSNFRDISATLAQKGFEHVSGILFDLGVSSYQLDEPSRGFSFRTDDTLDMRMDRTQALDARAVVNQYEERELADILWMYGEERASRRIAHAIVRRRAQSPLQTTGELTALVKGIVGERFLVKSLARVFQALRIEVNNELMNLEAALAQAIALLEVGGRLVVISYHSLEDRIVKDTMKREAASVQRSGNKLVPDIPLQPKIKILTKKPIQATDEECSRNPRSRSAKLRVAEKL